MNPIIVFLLLASCYATPLECEGCVFVVGKIEDYVENNKTMEYIIKEIESVCKYTKFVNICDKIIEYGFDDIIEFIKKYEYPIIVCQQLKLCNSSIYENSSSSSSSSSGE